MQIFYKQYRIVTEARAKSTNYEVFAPSKFGGRCEAVGYSLDDLRFSGTSELVAQGRCQDLIDVGFETPILNEIRKLAKY